eukprot:8553073-Alexandrium_andersonii.AAC.1
MRAANLDWRRRPKTRTRAKSRCTMLPSLGGSKSESSPPRRPPGSHSRPASQPGWTRRPNPRARQPRAWILGRQRAARGAASDGR